MSRSIVWRNLCVACILVFVGGESFAGVVADGAEIQEIGGGYSFTEGPAADSEGNVYFTDQPNDRIVKWSIDGTLSDWMSPCGRSNGLFFDAAGNLWACADEKNEMWRIGPDQENTVVIKDYEGKLLNGPNDLWIDPKGGVYFTDPFYKRPYWDRGPMEQDGQHVYYLKPNHEDLVRVVDDLEQPNGIIGTPDGKTIYVADIRAKKTYRFDVAEDGSLTHKKLFCEMGSDGMTIDNEGNVYLTGDGVFVFDPSGKQIDHIEVPEKWTANVSFGGKDMNTLFITASEGVYGIETRTHGVGSQ
ncbi:MAG: SMP-30/gluconolactonase/LRE family protein [Candidatus Omnitrophica bacterium]|nr:SMP-30/gluconolactonase/LRE family protein [Candidatus Omnitrophota bacterium]